MLGPTGHAGRPCSTGAQQNAVVVERRHQQFAEEDTLARQCAQVHVQAIVVGSLSLATGKGNGKLSSMQRAK